jgi:hydroxymethylpyrimidine pyrophosphatase-like HAD family hydrolase
VGDAENDVPFLGRCGYAVAVANAIPAVKEIADLVTEHAEGLGVVELADRILADHRFAIGTRAG